VGSYPAPRLPKSASPESRAHRGHAGRLPFSTPRTRVVKIMRASGQEPVEGYGHVSGDGREETPLERADRNMEELNGELRVVVTGVQVLFAFLLVVPFDTGFAHVGHFERAVYFVTLVLAALSAACTIAPSAQHRFLFRHDDKPHLVLFSNGVVMAGLGFLAMAMCGALLLVATKLFGTGAGLLTTAFGAAAFGSLWFAVPLKRRRALESSATPPSGSAHPR
jgi:hypothetical protein